MNNGLEFLAVGKFPVSTAQHPHEGSTLMIQLRNMNFAALLLQRTGLVETRMESAAEPISTELAGVRVVTIWNRWKSVLCSLSLFRTASAGKQEGDPLQTSERTDSGYLLADRFVSMSVGNTLVLKACGFIEDQQATILDVTESSLRIRTGHPWYARLLSGSRLKKPLEVALRIQPLPHQNDLSRFSPQNADRYCVIEARIAGRRISWSQPEFAEESRRLLWRLRSYFMAC